MSQTVEQTFSEIFKAYDIRGRTDTGQLQPEIARRIGSAFARFAAADEIAVARDCRPSSPELTAALIDGVTSQGVDVVDLGEVPTDVLYYISGVQDLPGVVVTASHNTSEWNGIKLCLPGAAPVGEGSGLEEVKELALTDPPAFDRASTRPFDPLPSYIAHLMTVVDPSALSGMRVAADGGNGMAGATLPTVMAQLGAELDGLFLDLDGSFPNHPADPLRPENIVDLVDLVKRGRHDLGVAFDGDADRAFFVDDAAEPVSGSTVTAMIARWFLAREPGAAIVHNLITSRTVPEIVREHGGRPIRTRVGHSFIKQVMADEGAVFGGEHSGHYYFRAHYRADSGMLAMLAMMQIIAESGAPLSELRRDVERYVSSGEINFRVEDKRSAMESVVVGLEDGVVDRLDGVTIEWPDRWLNLRPSNTEPFLRLNVEGPDRNSVDLLVRDVSKILERG